MQNALIEAIRRHIHLSEKDVEWVEKLCQQQVLEKDEHWLKEGEVCRHFAFIEKGLLRFYMNEDGQEITHFFADAGDFACNYESLLKHSASRKNIQAIEPTTLWTI